MFPRWRDGADLFTTFPDDGVPDAGASVLMTPDAKKIAKVLRTRQVLADDQREEEQRRLRDGEAPVKSMMAWLPCGERGWLARREKEKAKRHLGVE